MKRPARMVLMSLVTLLATGCAPIYTGAMAGGGPFRPRGAAIRPYDPPPIGRWDAVMSLDKGSTIGVLTADGVTRVGVIVHADLALLTLAESGAQRPIPRSDVVRVDLIRAAGRNKSMVKDAAVGAVAGAATAGLGLALFPYLASGDVWVPPARVWGVGAAFGAAAAVMNHKDDRRMRTIYIARIDGM
ncbi:MAG: hypothetical protein ABIS06_15445 [Vicinamibacterales bacterium]